MTEIMVSPAADLLLLETWDDVSGLHLPPAGRALMTDGMLALCVGPRRWWLQGAEPAPAAALVGTAGAVTPVGGGWVVALLHGADWRDLVMTSGLIDAEHASFDAGSVAVTRLDHAQSVIHVRAPDQCAVYLPGSLARHVLSGWDHQGWTVMKGHGHN